MHEASERPRRRRAEAAGPPEGAAPAGAEASPGAGSAAPKTTESAPETFERSITRLEVLVRDMESGRLDLEQSLAAFEEGIRLVKFCNERLQAAEKTVRKLVADMGGSFRLEPFEEGEDGEGAGGSEPR